MSIATEITRLQNAKESIKNAIENKGVNIPSEATIDEYASLIDDIPSGGSSNALWCGGNNPVLIASKKETINIADDTDFNSITPSYSDQVIKNQQLKWLTASDIDIDNYDYVTIVKCSINLLYSQDAPSNKKRIKNRAYFYVYNTGKYRQTPFDNPTVFSLTELYKAGNLYYNGNMDAYQAYVNGGIWMTSMYSPTYDSTNGTIDLSISDIRLKADNNYMSVESFDYLDTNNSNIIIESEIYRIDKNSPIVKVENDVSDALINGSFN